MPEGVLIAMLRTLLWCIFLVSLHVSAHETVYESVLVVEGREVNLLGASVSASEGMVGQKEMQLRPILRTGEILELVPGMVVTQHSGSGKANQYFLRGFNLDHGTDFATYVDGMPVNMRTHGHGQGYTDINFLIPELVHRLEYRKGAYYAEVGDFSGAGSAAFYTANRLEHAYSEFTVGEDNFLRLVSMESRETAYGDFVFAIEHNRYDGPWTDIEEDLAKTNLVMKYATPLADGKLSLTLMAYDNRWNSADQIPARAVTGGIIDELGSLDNTVGGESSRFSLSTQWQNDTLQMSAYIIDYSLNLWSNFTYFLDDETNGDQFEQVDDRIIYGGQISYSHNDQWFEKDVSNRFGAEFRIDDIDEVGLYKTRERARLGVVRSDAVEESSIGLYWQNEVNWTPDFDTVLGVRYDYFDFDVTDQAGVNTNGVLLSGNSGNTDDDLLSLKGSLIYALSASNELYLSAGQGFHSNDARGTTINVDPANGNAVTPVDPLVRSTGYELGIRSYTQQKFNASLALWTLELDSELLFVGDAGNTEVSGATTRQGIELTSYYHFTDVWTLDFEYAYTDAEFKDPVTAGGANVPGSIEHMLQAGISADFESGWFGSLRLRHLGERPLTEDGAVHSDSTTIWNVRVGLERKHWLFRADVLNLFDSNDHDIDYYYESRLTTEPSATGVEDIHYHVIEPRTIRLSLAYKY